MHIKAEHRASLFKVCLARRLTRCRRMVKCTWHKVFRTLGALATRTKELMQLALARGESQGNAAMKSTQNHETR